jgi:hypothetical protein
LGAQVTGEGLPSNFKRAGIEAARELALDDDGSDSGDIREDDVLANLVTGSGADTAFSITGLMTSELTSACCEEAASSITMSIRDNAAQSLSTEGARPAIDEPSGFMWAKTMGFVSVKTTGSGSKEATGTGCDAISEVGTGASASSELPSLDNEDNTCKGGGLDLTRGDAGQSRETTGSSVW